jgi:hypothetical protein
MQWRLLIEEYSSYLCYIKKGSHSVVADALSYLPKCTNSTLDNSLERYYTIMECHATTTSHYDFHPISYADLAEAQQRNPQIKKELQKDNFCYQI